MAKKPSRPMESQSADPLQSLLKTIALKRLQGTEEARKPAKAVKKARKKR
jgi:hypothetical protein